MAETGRPRAERSARGVKMYADTAEMLAWVLKLEGRKETAADFLEGVARAEVERRFEPLRKRVNAIKAAMSQKATPARKG